MASACVGAAVAGGGTSRKLKAAEGPSPVVSSMPPASSVGAKSSRTPGIGDSRATSPWIGAAADLAMTAAVIARRADRRGQKVGDGVAKHQCEIVASNRTSPRGVE